MPPVRQTVDAGTPIAERFSRPLSSPISNQVSDPATCFCMLAGKPGTGKSHFFLTNPNCLLVNVDQSQLPILPEVRAAAWPVKNTEGQLIDTNGASMTFQWEDLFNLTAILNEMANANEVRPQMVVLDTIAGLVSLGMDKILRDANATNWRDIDGRWGWDKLYNMIIALGTNLRNSGYGVWYVCHLVDKVLDLPGQDGQEKLVSLTITPNFWSRLFWQLDFVGIILRETVVRNVQREQNAGGHTRTINVQESVTQHTLTTSRNEYMGIAKTRVAMPEVALSRADAWQDFATAYMAASTQQ